MCREPGTTQEAIARALCVNKSSVARQLASLEQSGFVERRPCPTDSRAMEVYPTQKAFDALPAVRAVLAEWNERITDGFSDEERALFAALAERAAANARAEIERIRGGRGGRMRTVFQYLRPQAGRMAFQMFVKFIGTITELLLPWMLSHIPR